MMTIGQQIALVAGEVYRSPQPQKKDYALIKAGFNTVIDLENDQGEYYDEVLKLSPVVVISQPISFWQMHWPWSAIPVSRLDYLASLVNGVTKPVLVHCLEGRDRTGLVIAAYRVKYCGWTKDAAMAEAIKLGYRNYINFGLNRTWKEFETNQPKV